MKIEVTQASGRLTGTVTLDEGDEPGIVNLKPLRVNGTAIGGWSVEVEADGLNARAFDSDPTAAIERAVSAWLSLAIQHDEAREESRRE